MRAEAIGPEEFERLYRALAPELFAYVRRRSTADPEDVVADVFTAAWRRRADLPEPELRRAWLYGAARNLLLAESRYWTRMRAAVDELGAIAGTADGAEPETRNQIVREALNRLGPEEREIILLTEWERLTPTEAALTLGIKPGTARVRLYRARRALAEDAEVSALLAAGAKVGPPGP